MTDDLVSARTAQMEQPSVALFSAENAIEYRARGLYDERAGHRKLASVRPVETCLIPMRIQTDPVVVVAKARERHGQMRPRDTHWYEKTPRAFVDRRGEAGIFDQDTIGMQPGMPLARDEGKRGAACGRCVSGRWRVLRVRSCSHALSLTWPNGMHAIEMHPGGRGQGGAFGGVGQDAQVQFWK